MLQSSRRGYSGQRGSDWFIIRAVPNSNQIPADFAVRVLVLSAGMGLEDTRQAALRTALSGPTFENGK